jgi:hypothetical protein
MPGFSDGSATPHTVGDAWRRQCRSSDALWITRYFEAPAVAGVELLLDFSVELDVLLSLEVELAPESLFEDSVVEPFDFLADSRLSVR